VVIIMRRPRKRFLAIAVLVLLALLRVESIHARMQGRVRSPERILRLERLPAGARVHLMGWSVELPPAVAQALARFWR
jgi:hypothetical protein